MPPSFEKSPAELVARFDSVVARFPAGERRKMFGYPALFVAGNLATSLFDDRWVVRLSADDVERVLALPGAGAFAPMPGRPMRGYTLLPAAIAGDADAAGTWVDRAIDHVATLPPKQK